MINVNKNAAELKAVNELKTGKGLSKNVKLQQNKYLNNRVVQDHRFIKWLVKLGMEFRSFNTAGRTIKGYEIMQMLKKGQIEEVKKEAVQKRVFFMAEIFRSDQVFATPR